MSHNIVTNPLDNCNELLRGFMFMRSNIEF